MFYGAVGAGSKQPELAYEFISMFLTEDFSVEHFPVSSVVTIGWPARYRGNAEELSQQRISSETFAYFAMVDGQDALPEIKDEDIILLNAKIDRVQYFTALEGELSTIITTLNDPETDAALPVDIDAVAKEFYDKLYFYLYE